MTLMKTNAIFAKVIKRLLLYLVRILPQSSTFILSLSNEKDELANTLTTNNFPVFIILFYEIERSFLLFIKIVAVELS